MFRLVKSKSNGNFNDTFSIILSGTANTMDSFAPYSAILSGEGNHIDGDTTLSISGWHNGFDVIGGGRGNFMGADYYPSGFNVIVGGDSNHVDFGNYDNFLGGGKNNWIDDAYGVIVGGLGNSFSSESGYNVIVGGRGNSIGANSNWNTMGGGDSNSILTGVDRAFSGGGCFNSISAKWGIIVGGCGNKITDTLSFVGGGQDNYIGGVYSTISGGITNYIGNWDSTYPHPLPAGYIPPHSAAIAGGAQDTASGHYSAIGGGINNNAVGKYATIPGGVGLIAYDFQTVVGRYNANIADTLALNNYSSYLSFVPLPGDTFAIRDSLLPADAPIFIVGNGASPYEIHYKDGDSALDVRRSNAFTVSNSGASTVYQTLEFVNTINSATWPSTGSTYQENTIVAEADVPSFGGPIPPMSIGVDSIGHMGPGIYLIRIRTKDPVTGFPDTLNHAVITVTVQDTTTDPTHAGIMCGYATCTHIGIPKANEFIVRTYAGGAVGCSSADFGFYFHLTGKKE